MRYQSSAMPRYATGARVSWVRVVCPADLILRTARDVQVPTSYETEGSCVHTLLSVMRTKARRRVSYRVCHVIPSCFISSYQKYGDFQRANLETETAYSQDVSGRSIKVMGWWGCPRKVPSWLEPGLGHSTTTIAVTIVCLASRSDNAEIQFHARDFILQLNHHNHCFCHYQTL